jgi:1,4-dihydroxy-2-naphthoyl-CoA hydrolase
MGALAERMGITLVECGPERVVLTMPVEGNTQPFGLLHGGANAVLVETAGSIGAAMHAGPENMVVGLDISVTHHRSAREGMVTATAEPLSLGRTVTSYQVRVVDDQGRALCTGRLTCLIRPAAGV